MELDEEQWRYLGAFLAFIAVILMLGSMVILSGLVSLGIDPMSSVFSFLAGMLFLYGATVAFGNLKTGKKRIKA